MFSRLGLLSTLSRSPKTPIAQPAVKLTRVSMHHYMNSSRAKSNMRESFSNKLATMFKEEMPEYGQLVTLVNHVNEKVINQNPSLLGTKTKQQYLNLLLQERHGALRLSKPEELNMVGRIMDVMGMKPVDFYPLTASGVPVNSTVFRPVTTDEIEACPFRLFTSLVDRDYLQKLDPEKAAVFESVVVKRDLFSKDLRRLLFEMESKATVSASLQDEFLKHVVDVFKFKPEIVPFLDRKTYHLLAELHPILPDMVLGSHLNHLTPDTLDITEVQKRLELSTNLDAMTLQGPPLTTPVLLNQTSFKAPPVSLPLLDGNIEHKARFGEVEQRHIALTSKGRALYDNCLKQVSQLTDKTNKKDIDTIFSRTFPKDNIVLFKDELAYFTFKLTSQGALKLKTRSDVNDFTTLCQHIEDGNIEIIPIKYEDFLPVSAAGIFKSNGNVKPIVDQCDVDFLDISKVKADFEISLGKKVLDPFALYDQVQERSLSELKFVLDGGVFDPYF